MRHTHCDHRRTPLPRGERSRNEWRTAIGLQRSAPAIAPAISPSAPHQRIVAGSGDRWRGVSAELCPHPPTSGSEYRDEHHVVALHVGRAHRITYRRAGTVSTTLRRRGDLLLAPAGQTARCDWREPAEALLVRLDPALVATVAAASPDVDPARVELQSIDTLRDPQLEQIGLALLGELRADGLGGPSTRRRWGSSWRSTSSATTPRWATPPRAWRAAAYLGRRCAR